MVDIFIRVFLRESNVDNHMFIGWINYIMLIIHIENFVYFAVFSYLYVPKFIDYVVILTIRQVCISKYILVLKNSLVRSEVLIFSDSNTSKDKRFFSLSLL